MKNHSTMTLSVISLCAFILTGCSTFQGSSYFQGVKARLEQGADINAGINKNADTLLHISVQNNNVGEVKYLLESGANPNKNNAAGFPPLFYINTSKKQTEDKNQAKIITLLSKHSVDINAKMKDGTTALSTAILDNRPLSVEALIEASADVSLKYEDETPLMIAVKAGNTRIIEMLLNKSQKLNIQNKKGQTALHFTALKESQGTDESLAAIAKQLIKAGAKLPKVYSTSILNTAIMNKRPLVAKTLMNAVESEKNPTRDYFTPLMNAVYEADIDLIEEYLKTIKNINQKDKHGWSALHLIAHTEGKGSDRQKRKIANLLIKAGADVNLPGPSNNTALNIAINNNKENIALNLLDENTATDIENNKGENALHKAVQVGSLKLVKRISSPKNINSQDNYGWSALHFASSSETILSTRKRHEIVDFLLTSNANLNLQNNNGETPLTLAIASNLSTIAHKLINNQADISLRNNKGQTALMVAAGQANVELVKELLTIPQNLDIKDNSGWTALHFATNSIITRNDDNSAKIIQLLINAGASTDLQTNNRDSALHFSVSRNSFATTEILSKSKINPSLKNNQNLTALMIAVKNGNYPITKTLTQNIKDSRALDLRQNNGWTALNLTAHTSSKGTDHTQAKIAEAIIKAGSNVNSQITTGETTLGIAIGNNRPEVAKVLLNSGARTDITDNNGWTPLMLAVYLGQVDIIRQAAQWSRNINLKNSDGLTALHLTANSNSYGGDKLQAQVAKILLEAGADVDAKAVEGSTPLHFAAANNKIAVAKVLINKNASPKIKNFKGWTPKDEAQKAKNVGITQLFK